MSLTERIKAGQSEPTKLVPVRMSPFVRALHEKRLPVKVVGGSTLVNGSWRPDGEGTPA